MSLRQKDIKNNLSDRWYDSFSVVLQQALIIWASKRCLALSLYGGGGSIIKTDNSRFRSRDHSIIGSYSIVVKARKFVKLWSPSQHLSEEKNKQKQERLLAGGMCFDSNVKRTPSSFYQLAIFAASFLLVTTREINNSFRVPIEFPELDHSPEIQYLQSKHWKLPPDESIRIVFEYFNQAHPQNQIIQLILDKILEEWKRLIVSEYKDGFPIAPPVQLPTSTRPISTPEIINPRYETTYFISPQQSLIGPRPLIFNKWYKNIFSHPVKSLTTSSPNISNNHNNITINSSENNTNISSLPSSTTSTTTISTTTTSTTTLIPPFTKTSGTSITSSPPINSTISISNNIDTNKVSSTKQQPKEGKARPKFVALSEKEAQIIPQVAKKVKEIFPHNSRNYIYQNNCWIQSDLISSEVNENMEEVVSNEKSNIQIKEENIISNVKPEDNEEKQKDSNNNVSKTNDEDVLKESIENNDLNSFTSLNNQQIINWQLINCCILCKGSEENSMLGRLLVVPSRGQWVHSNCLKCSHGIFETDSGILEGIEDLLKRCVDSICTLCGRNGATIKCDRSTCHQIYHLECAVACDYIFRKMKQEYDPQEIELKSHQVLCKYKTIGTCVLHRDLDIKKGPIWNINNSKTFLRVGESDISQISAVNLSNPKLVAVTKSVDERMKNKANLLRIGGSLRVGSLTVHKLGTLSFELPGHHTSDCIFPVGFRSTRIFWSMKTPLMRVLYTFEIQSYEFDETNPLQKLLYPVPRFVVTVSDQSDLIISSRSIIELFHKIMNAVFLCQKSSLALIEPNSASVFSSKSTTYSQNPYIFFGIGLKTVRYALETQSESLATILPSYFFSTYPLCENLPQYKPRVYLPSITQFREALRRRMQHRHTTRKNLHGSSRAEGYVREKRFLSEKRVKNLAKAIDENLGGNNDTDERVDIYDDDDDENENLRKKSRMEAKYRELSENYLFNPFSKLLVKRSDIHGWGLFAKVEFPKDSMVVEYIGEQIRQTVADIREETYDKEGVGSCYLFRLDKENIIDATRCGGMARFMNHCCEPNAYAKIITCTNQNTLTTTSSNTNNTNVGINESKHIVIFANRTIQPGEEITYDYKFPIEDNKLKCYCGAAKCQGTMN